MPVVGAGNVALVYANWGRLPDQDHRLLVHMALVSLDRDKPDQPARMYFAGWRSMALALGRDLSDAPEGPEGVKVAKAAEKAVGRCVARLVKAGAIKPVRGNVGFGVRQEYALVFDASSPPSDGVQQPPTGRGALPPT
jgi:hypothetical protein